MSFNLRLPPALDAAARSRAEAVGISLNAFVCVALNAYLEGAPGSPVAAKPEPAPVKPARPKEAARAPVAVKQSGKAGGKLSKAEKVRLHNLKYEKQKASVQRDLLEKE